MDKNKITILLIEDNPGDTFLIKEMLSLSDSTIFDVHNEQYMQNALAYVKGKKIDLVLCDLGLPDCNGLESLSRIRKSVPELPIVVITGLDNEMIGLKAVQLGAQDYLIKGDFEYGLLPRVICYAIERKKIEDILRESESCLSKKNREILEFTDAVTHDLKIPLCAIKTAYTLLSNTADCKSDEDLQQVSGAGFEAIEYMEELLDDLLSCAQLDAEVQELEKEEVSVKEIVDEVCNRLQSIIQEKKIDIFVDITSSVYADRKCIKRIFMNLIGNSVNYIGEGAKKQITVGTGHEKGNYLLFVRDTGIGIPADSLKEICHKFVRGKNVNDIKGTGLGLYIVKKSVACHGGRIWMESKEGEGTTFYFTLPEKQL